MAAGGKRIGIIGLDTSHVIAFVDALNTDNQKPEYKGYKIVAAYPKGSADIKSSTDRIPGYTEDVKKKGVEIVDSIESLLKKVDAVMLETNDGRIHLEQALPVIKAKKPLFIDKPITASLADAIAIFNVAKKYKVPVFCSSSLRFTETAQDAATGKLGKIRGADTYSPYKIEKTHPDFFWYGVHGIESLFTIMGTGCKSVVRIHQEDNEVAVGTWEDGRIGVFRGIHNGKDYGGTVFTDKGPVTVSPFKGYEPLLMKVIDFFETGNSPVDEKETLEIYAFMEACDESKNKGGVPVELKDMFARAKPKY